MDSLSILYPVIGMVFLTMLVATRMYTHRVSFMKKNRIHPQKVQTRAQALDQLTDTRASDNFLNLFEMPVLFYLACITLYVTNSVSFLLVVLAWVYVALRIVHSIIHCSYNTVMHRFMAFMSSTIVLFAIWILIALQLVFGIHI